MSNRHDFCRGWTLHIGLGVLLCAAASGSCNGEVGDPMGVGGSAGVTATGVGYGGGLPSGGSGGTAPTGTGGTSTAAAGSGGAGAGGSGAGGTGGSATGGSAGSGGSGAAPLNCAATGPRDCSTNSPASYECDGVNNTYQQQVNAAVAYVRDNNPTWFDYDAGPAPCCPVALQPTAFRDAVVAHINANGLCAAPDPNHAQRELAVKLNNDCNEGYLILTSQWVVRSPAFHSYTCEPAWL